MSDKSRAVSEIGLLAHDVSRMRRTLFDQAMKPLGLTRAQGAVLYQLSLRKPAGQQQTELARRLDVGKVTIGGLIDRLETAGYVERVAVAHDRRAREVVITPSGEAVLGRVVDLAEHLNAVVMAGIPSEFVRVGEATLGAMKDNLRRAVSDWSDADPPAPARREDARRPEVVGPPNAWRLLALAET